MDYAKINTSDGAIIEAPSPIPPELVGLADETLADLSVIKPLPAKFAGFAWRVIQPADPISEGKISTAQTVQFVNNQPKYVHALADAPVVYRTIDKVEAIALIRVVTGMTDEQELAFRDDTRLALFWRKWGEDVGSVIHRDNPLTEGVLNAVQATSYISAGQRQALLDNWPTV